MSFDKTETNMIFTLRMALILDPLRKKRLTYTVRFILPYLSTVNTILQFVVTDSNLVSCERPCRQVLVAPMAEATPESLPRPVRNFLIYH